MSISNMLRTLCIPQDVDAPMHFMYFRSTLTESELHKCFARALSILQPDKTVFHQGRPIDVTRMPAGVNHPSEIYFITLKPDPDETSPVFNLRAAKWVKPGALAVLRNDLIYGSALVATRAIRRADMFLEGEHAVRSEAVSSRRELMAELGTPKYMGSARGPIVDLPSDFEDPTLPDFWEDDYDTPMSYVWDAWLKEHPGENPDGKP